MRFNKVEVFASGNKWPFSVEPEAYIVQIIIIVIPNIMKMTTCSHDPNTHIIHGPPT